MDMKTRSKLRTKNIVGHRAKNFADAYHWDLEFWQKQSPGTRLSALVAIRNDIRKIANGRKRANRSR